MIIRRAKAADAAGINKLLKQVLMVHHEGRPDLFKADCKKYTDSELLDIINDDSKPIFVADEGGNVVGYAFCVHKQYINNNILTDIKSLYIDDLCVDEEHRGHHVGKSIFDYVTEYGKANGYYNLTLNVWSCNESAMRFYEKCGLRPQKIGLETIL